MTIYNFNEVSGGSTPVEVEVSNLKIGDIIITNRENVAAYEAEGVDLFKLTYYNQIVNAADYPKIAELTDYQYNAQITSTSFDSDQVINSYSGYHHFIRDLDNTFYMFPVSISSAVYYLNSDNNYTNIATTNTFFAKDISLFINFDNYTKILIISKTATYSSNISAVIFNKLTNTFSTVLNILTGVNTTTSRPVAARLMPDGLIYIVCQTTDGNITILRTSDGIVFENWHTTTLNHSTSIYNNNSYFDEKGTLNIDDDYNFYYTQNNTTTLRSLNKINLLTKIKTTNLFTYTITLNDNTRMAINLKNNQIALYQSQSGNNLKFIIYNILESTNNNYTITLNNTTLIEHLILVDFNNLFITKYAGNELVFTNDFTNFTQYNYNSLGTSYTTDTKSIDFRYNNFRLIYKLTSGTGTLKRNISVNKVADTLLLPKAPFSNYQADSYLITDIETGV